jgi:hypothetical protein
MNYRKKLIFLCLCFATLTSANGQTKQSIPSPEITFKYLGKAIEKKDTHVWCTSAIVDKNGKFHFYVSEWPVPKDPTERFSGWLKHCQIVHYVADSPQGPFEFVRTVVKDLDGEFNAPHNPTVKYIDGKYILSFIVNENDDLSKSRILMYVSDDLDDNWRPIKGGETDGTVLRAPKDTSIWSHKAILGVCNPTLIKYKGKYMLYHKVVVPHKNPTKQNNGRDYGYGVAISDKLEGPYKFYPNRVTADGVQLEDAYAFEFDGTVCMLSRDYMGSKGSRGGGLLWVSSDGYNFSYETTKRSFEELKDYVPQDYLKNATVYRGTIDGHLERPQLLYVNRVPKYMYVATGVNTTPGHGSASHVFEIQIKK